MSVARPSGSVGDRLAVAAASALIGRADERARLRALLAPRGPAVVFVHGSGGIGKSALVNGTLSELPLSWISVDGRHVEPTVPGMLTALGTALGASQPTTAAAAADQVAATGLDVLVIDNFERLNLLDGWIRNELVGSLPASVTTVLVGRRAPNAAWRTTPGWRALFAELMVGPLAEAEVDQLLGALGVCDAEAARIRAFARGHPLAVVAAAEALTRRPWLHLTSGAPAEVVEDLFAVLLDDLEPRERALVEAASVLRRVTLPLLTAIADEPDPEQAWQTLRRMPFATTTATGLEFSEPAAPVLLEGLELRDPARVRTLRRRAARAILESLDDGPHWESTADLLHLVQNPLIRNAYAPPGMLQHPVEQARRDDHDEVVAITRRFCGEQTGRLVQRWWQARRQSFSVVRLDHGGVAAFSVVDTVDDRAALAGEDPAMQAIATHLTVEPMPGGADAVVFRWALGRRHGERPTPEVAALVIDLKRTYLQLRTTLRRVYTVVADWPAAAAVLRVMGFDLLTQVAVGGRRCAVACLDFGPGGVDAWIAQHVLTEHAEPLPAARSGAGLDRGPLFRLTAREQEVLTLLAEGMTNVQLAERLFISERTANRHVSNVFTKLGVHNRTQAARVAVAAGLVG